MGRERQEFPNEFIAEQRMVSEVPQAKIEQCAARSLQTKVIDKAYERAVKISFSETAGEWICEEAYVKLKETPFQEGSFRKCYEMWEKGRRKDSKMVAKIFKEYTSAQKYFDEAMLQLIASQYAKRFNSISGSSRQISFLPVSIYKLLERSNQFITAEPFLDGKYVKHNDNDGHVDTKDPLPQAFSHFTWEASGRKLLVCDVQGVGDVYTDPSICSMAENDEDCFGSSDRGPGAIRKFFASHRCNDHCIACGVNHQNSLPQAAPRTSEPTPTPWARQPEPAKKKGSSLWTVGKAYGRSLIHALGMSSAPLPSQRQFQAPQRSQSSHSSAAPQALRRSGEDTTRARSDGSPAARPPRQRPASVRAASS